ncbi:uncharacterized protein LOC133832224 [Humulus lupulus]|uniref:uncharacterized protein LOC133832224 n=1 Tax=Humulus lupulus TaxID=3486 RepID=UPI002B407C74|nr:uncharacterized protein LOC133832224 [Humulus lupulus]
METFYNGLNTYTRMVVDDSGNGVLLAKSYNEAYEILERISNNYQWPTTRSSTGRKVASIHDVDAITSLAAQVSSILNMLKTMNMGMNQSMGQPMGSQMGQMENISCVYCGEGHIFYNCPSNFAVVCYMGNQNRNGPYSNSYNPSWRQHPNFSWNNQWRSGKELENNKTNSGHEDEPTSIQINEEIQNDVEISSVPKFASAQNVAQLLQHSRPDSSISKQLPPFPQRFQKQKLDSQFKKFLDMLKQLHINIPLVEELEQMPNYVKFMKDVLTRKRRL